MSAAERAAERWFQAAELTSTPWVAQSQLRKVLRWTLAEDAETGIGFIDDQPVVVAIDGERLICARPVDPVADGADAVIAVDSLPLDRTLRVAVSFSQREFPHGWFMIRSWTLGEPGPGAVRIDTRSLVSAFNQIDDGGNALLEQVAARLGWQLPGMS
jgi:hypothetical protein